ncbi:MAG: DUF4389 domain-containing protein [Chloroflexi bacterium]|nr:DUF4389 domain-containing protein [Chloroflexota bacterium]MCY3589160.1 DUF4389 domain-containing protein [Chloroflexota bacterium]MCY3686156.1 DUF4389 domain-containing protein [Chloroflexota bacterium]MDE2708777.1 DUF4389 domain-containing protein [Chloroflexota bacterium]
MEHQPDAYPARLEIDYPESRDRLSIVLRIPFAIPIVILSYLMPVAPLLAISLAVEGLIDDSATGWLAAAFFLPLVLMILVRNKYPRWWFDFLINLSRFQYRVSAYISLLTDQYPSTDEEQSVHLDLDYPDAEQLNQYLPIIKWLLLIPHYIVLVILGVLAFLATIVAWFAILITGKHPRPLFDFTVGVGRYWLRVEAYGFLLITDRYPPFRLGA